MNNLILTTPEELKSIIQEAVTNAIPKHEKIKELPDTVCLEDALAILRENGYPTSKAKMYKLTSTGGIPCQTYGNKLVFSRKELLRWAEGQTKPKHDTTVIRQTLAKSARLKR